MSECGATVGSKPWYLNADQWDASACGCDLPSEHEGSHQCEHTRSERIRGPVPSLDPSPPAEWQRVIDVVTDSLANKPAEFTVECNTCGLQLSVNEHPLADQPCIRCGGTARLYKPESPETANRLIRALERYDRSLHPSVLRLDIQPIIEAARKHLHCCCPAWDTDTEGEA